MTSVSDSCSFVSSGQFRNGDSIEKYKSSCAILRQFYCAGSRHHNLRDYFLTLDTIIAWIEVWIIAPKISSSDNVGNRDQCSSLLSLCDWLLEIDYFGSIFTTLDIWETALSANCTVYTPHNVSVRGGYAPPRDPTLYPCIYRFWQKGTPLIYLYWLHSLSKPS